MPTYDYQCDRCHHRFELKQSFSSGPVTDCPMCGGESHRKIHAVPVVFKGSGWYVKDYGKGISGLSDDSRDGKGVEKGDTQGESGGEGAKPEAAKAEESKTGEAKVEKAKAGGE